MNDYTYTVSPITDEQRGKFPILSRLANLAERAVKASKPKRFKTIYDSGVDSSKSAPKIETFTVGNLTLRVRRA